MSKSALRLGIFLMVLNAPGRFNKSSRIEWHRNHYLTIKVKNSKKLLLEDSIRAGLAHYQIVWKKYFVLLNTMNLGIGGARVENPFTTTIVRTK